MHAATDKKAAEFLPELAELECSKRLHAHEFRPPHELVARHQARFSEAWHAHSES